MTIRRILGPLAAVTIAVALSLGVMPADARSTTEPSHPAPSNVATGTTAQTGAIGGVDQINSPTTTARMAADTNAITKDGSDTNATGRVVFLVVVAVIVIGAVVVGVNARRRRREARDS